MRTQVGGDFAHAVHQPGQTAWAKSQARPSRICALRSAILPTLRAAAEPRNDEYKCQSHHTGFDASAALIYRNSPINWPASSVAKRGGEFSNSLLISLHLREFEHGPRGLRTEQVSKREVNDANALDSDCRIGGRVDDAGPRTAGDLACGRGHCHGSDVA